MSLRTFVFGCATVALGSVGCGQHSGSGTSPKSSGGTSSSGGGTASGGSDAATASGGAQAGSPNGGAQNGGAAETGGAGGGAGGTEPFTGNAPYDWVGVIGTGQSLSNGTTIDGEAISLTQPFANLKLQDDGPEPRYPVDGSAAAVWSVVPLTEPIRVTAADADINQTYPNNIWPNGETPHSGMANTLSALWQARGLGDYVSAHSVVGQGGMPLIYLVKGLTSYAAALSEASVFTQLAEAAGKTYGVGGIILTHGEADATNADYEAGVYQLWQDYNTDLKAITGQTDDVVLFASQQSSSSHVGDSSAIEIWRAGVDHPGKIVCTGPKYQFFRSDPAHLPPPAYERLGEKYAEVFDLVVNQKLDWKPVQPTTATLDGSTLTIDFDVPNPPLTWDENISAPHQSTHTAWANGRGFELRDGVDEVTIASAEIADSGTSVILTLAQAPAQDAALTLDYANTSDLDGGIGQLRDSDEFIGYDSETVDVEVTQGSAEVHAASPAFYKRAGRDVVTGSDLPAGTVIIAMNGQYGLHPDTLTLSAPWTGATGMAQLSFHHDHHNYCVHFSLPVP